MVQKILRRAPAAALARNVVKNKKNSEKILEFFLSLFRDFSGRASAEAPARRVTKKQILKR
jgi:hypothetical protein